MVGTLALAAGLITAGVALSSTYFREEFTLGKDEVVWLAIPALIIVLVAILTTLLRDFRNMKVERLNFDFFGINAQLRKKSKDEDDA